MTIIGAIGADYGAWSSDLAQSLDGAGDAVLQRPVPEYSVLLDDDGR